MKQLSLAGHPPTFLADAMLGRLARWLRVLGYDTLLNPAQLDRDLVNIADAEDRILLTRDRHLMTFLRPKYGLLIEANAPQQQLRQVVTELDLPAPAELFTRCLICNTPVRPATAAEAALHLPADLKNTPPEQTRFCPGCGRLYWYGSHTQRMREQLETLLPDWLPRPD